MDCFADVLAAFLDLGTLRFRCSLCRVGELLDFIKDILVCVPKMNEALAGLERHEAQDGGISELNLDYFGPVDECSSDSETDTPLPGVDPGIYELTTAKMENNATGRYIADAFTKLMESMEKTRTTARKPEKDEKMSKEAAKVISLLPDLSFMQARVLMFPSILTPAANHI